MSPSISLSRSATSFGITSLPCSLINLERLSAGSCDSLVKAFHILKRSTSLPKGLRISIKPLVLGLMFNAPPSLKTSPCIIKPSSAPSTDLDRRASIYATGLYSLIVLNWSAMPWANFLQKLSRIPLMRSTMVFFCGANTGLAAFIKSSGTPSKDSGFRGGRFCKAVEIFFFISSGKLRSISSLSTLNSPLLLMADLICVG